MTLGTGHPLRRVCPRSDLSRRRTRAIPRARAVGGYEGRLGLSEDEERELGFDYNSLVRHGKAAHLEAHPDDHAIRRLLVERLVALSRFGQAAELMPTDDPCGNEDRCRAALLGGRALVGLGRTDEAARVMRRLRPAAERAGLLAHWDDIWRDLSRRPHDDHPPGPG